jgi:hypothetical protein
MFLSSLFAYASYVELIVLVLLSFHLFKSGLARRYRSFSIFVVFSAIRLAIPTFVSMRPKVYAYFYFASEAILYLLLVLLVMELYNLVLENHPGLARASRFVLAASMWIAVVGSLLTLNLNLFSTTSQTQTLDTLFVVGRVVMFSLMLFLVLIVTFLWYFPVPLNRNLIVHCGLFGTYLLIKTTILFTRNALGNSSAPLLNLALAIYPIILFGLWHYLLRVSGEYTPARRTPNLSEEQRSHLLQGLEGLNDSLVRSLDKPK